MKVIKTEFEDVKIIEPNIFEDQRGFFLESYNEQTFLDAGIEYRFIQDNHSLSAEAGILRGLHYQLAPHAQTKLVRVVTGAIYDVVVDIRKSSPSFGKWIGVCLSERNKRQILVPKGYAHGFCTLLPNSQVIYKVDQYYSPEHDKGILWSDQELSIDWPLIYPILSEKDSKHPLLRDAELNYE